jgi:hypothetical protein
VAVVLLGGGALLMNGARGDPPDDPFPFAPTPGPTSETTDEPEPTTDKPLPTTDDPPDVAVGDECLVGEWEGAGFTLTWDDVSFSGGDGMYLTIDESGNAIYDFSVMDNLVAEGNGSVAELVFDGQIQSRVHADTTGTFTDSVVADNSAFVLMVDGVVAGSPVSVLQGLGWTPTETYTCDETTLTIGDGPGYSYERQ